MSKYQQAIDLHNKAIDILEKRQRAINTLSGAEKNVEIWKTGKRAISVMYSLEELEHAVKLQQRYIKLLARAYAKLAASVCAKVNQSIGLLDAAYYGKGNVQIYDRNRDVTEVLEEMKNNPDFKKIASGTIKDSPDERSFFDLMTNPSSAELRNMIIPNFLFDNKGNITINDQKAD